MDPMSRKRTKGDYMSYSCQEEADYYESGAAEAEAEQNEIEYYYHLQLGMDEMELWLESLNKRLEVWS